MDEAIRVELAITRDTDPISGTIATGGGARTFTGWLELATLIEATRDAERGTET